MPAILKKIFIILSSHCFLKIEESYDNLYAKSDKVATLNFHIMNTILKYSLELDYLVLQYIKTMPNFFHTFLETNLANIRIPSLANLWFVKRAHILQDTSKYPALLPKYSINCFQIERQSTLYIFPHFWWI